MTKEKKPILYRLGMFLVGMSGHGRDVIKHIAKTGAKDINLGKVETFIEGVEVEENGITLESGEIDNYCEQYLYRKLSCSKCFSDKKCPHCECEFPLKMQTPSQYCDAGEWGELMEQGDWLDYKEDNGIFFELKTNFKDAE